MIDGLHSVAINILNTIYVELLNDCNRLRKQLLSQDDLNDDTIELYNRTMVACNSVQETIDNLHLLRG